MTSRSAPGTVGASQLVKAKDQRHAGYFDTKEEAARPLPTVAPPTINPPTVKGVVLPTKTEAKGPQMSATPAQTGAAMSATGRAAWREMAKVPGSPRPSTVYRATETERNYVICMCHLTHFR